MKRPKNFRSLKKLSKDPVGSLTMLLSELAEQQIPTYRQLLNRLIMDHGYRSFQLALANYSKVGTVKITTVLGDTATNVLYSTMVIRFAILCYNSLPTTQVLSQLAAFEEYAQAFPGSLSKSAIEEYDVPDREVKQLFSAILANPQYTGTGDQFKNSVKLTTIQDYTTLLNRTMLDVSSSTDIDFLGSLTYYTQ
jgi:hypothetical protein